MANVKRIQRDIELLRDITEPCEEGTTRLSYTGAYRRAVDALKQEMLSNGITPREDGIGNLYGVVEGSDPSAGKIISGSHLDTVLCSGAFDGQAGIVCALEVARMLKEQNCPLKSSFEVVATIMEDGARFPGLGGSSFIAGVFGDAELDRFCDGSGISIRRAATAYGASCDLTKTSRVGEKPKAYIELHMEQGVKLERSGIPIGLVDTICGRFAAYFTFHGAVSHPSTPMGLRRDTALAACDFITRMSRLVQQNYQSKNGEACENITCGMFRPHPGVANAIPSRTEFSLDFRAPKQEYLDEIQRFVAQELPRIEEEYRITAEYIVDPPAYPTNTDAAVVTALEQAAEHLHIPYMHLISGPGHDAQMFAKLCNIGMVFVPSRGGLTHCPQEWTDYENLARGADLIFEAVQRIDRA